MRSQATDKKNLEGHSEEMVSNADHALEGAVPSAASSSSNSSPVSIRSRSNSSESDRGSDGSMPGILGGGAERSNTPSPEPEVGAVSKGHEEGVQAENLRERLSEGVDTLLEKELHKVVGEEQKLESDTKISQEDTTQARILEYKHHLGSAGIGFGDDRCPETTTSMGWSLLQAGLRSNRGGTPEPVSKEEYLRDLEASRKISDAEFDSIFGALIGCQPTDIDIN